MFDAENQKIKVRVNNFNENHFRDLGYSFDRNDYIEIFVKELPIGSGFKIAVECNYCHKIFKKAYRRYLETKSDICCIDCKQIKSEKSTFEKYGNICSLRNNEVQEKSKKKNLKNLGVEFPFQNKNILKKCVDSCIEKYGRGYITVNVSSQQRYIHKIYGGNLNYTEFPFRLDIFFEKEKIYFEYDGSGHLLRIIKGQLTKSEFEEKEIVRQNFLKDLGYKEFRIISSNDILPSDEELLKIKDKAFYLLLDKNYQKYIYNLNTKTESFEE